MGDAVSVKTTWLIENRVIYLHLIGDVTIEEIEATSTQVLQMFEQSAHQLVHVIHDATDLDNLPTKLKALADVTSTVWNHQKMGWTVAFNVQKPVLGFLGNMLSKLFRTRYRIVNTRQDALDFLAHVDVSLPQDDNLIN